MHNTINFVIDIIFHISAIISMILHPNDIYFLSLTLLILPTTITMTKKQQQQHDNNNDMPPSQHECWLLCQSFRGSPPYAADGTARLPLLPCFVVVALLPNVYPSPPPTQRLASLRCFASSSKPPHVPPHQHLRWLLYIKKPQMPLAPRLPLLRCCCFASSSKLPHVPPPTFTLIVIFKKSRKCHWSLAYLCCLAMLSEPSWLSFPAADATARLGCPLLAVEPAIRSRHGHSDGAIPLVLVLAHCLCTADKNLSEQKNCPSWCCTSLLLPTNIWVNRKKYSVIITISFHSQHCPTHILEINFSFQILIPSVERNIRVNRYFIFIPLTNIWVKRKIYSLVTTSFHSQLFPTRKYSWTSSSSSSIDSIVSTIIISSFSSIRQ